MVNSASMCNVRSGFNQTREYSTYRNIFEKFYKKQNAFEYHELVILDNVANNP